jgi:hypothetical protein
MSAQPTYTTTVAPTLSNIYQDLRSFLLTVVGPDVPVIQGIDNRVPMPENPFVAMTAIGSYRIETNQDTYVDGFFASPQVAGTTQSLQATKLAFQLDFYGPQSNAWATMVGTLFRDDVACEIFQIAQPLYADDPRMMPMITAEDQFLERWTVNAYVQYNPVVTTTLTFATSLNVTPINVSEEFPK